MTQPYDQSVTELLPRIKVLQNFYLGSKCYSNFSLGQVLQL